MSMTKIHRLILPAILVTLAGCATTNPEASFEATRELVAGRHPGEMTWPRNDEARAEAEERVRELLAAPLTPDAAAEIALLRNPQLHATLENLGIAQAELAQATRLANPGVSFARLSGDGATQRTVAVSVEIVDWLVQPLRRRLAEAEVERTRLEVGQAWLDAVVEARLALVRYQAAAQLAERLVKIEEIDRAAADYAKALFEAGNLTALERANAEAGWAETRAELGRANLETLNRREAVVLALGLSEDESWQTVPRLPSPEADELDPQALQRQAIERRLDLAAARWAVDALGRALALKKGTRYFPVGVEVGVERERETDGVTLTGPTVELRLPIFDTGKASIAKLEAELEQARWQLTAREGAVRSAVRQKTAALTAARELVELYQGTLLPLRLEVLERTLAEYNQMLIGTFDVLIAKQQEVEAERRAVDALAAYWEARVELEHAVGAPLLPSHNHSAAGDPETQP